MGTIAFHLVDGIDDYEPFLRFRAHTLAPAGAHGGTEEFPPLLILEALGQAGNWLLLLSSDLHTMGMLAAIGSVSFGAPVHRGDMLELVGAVDVLRDDAATMSGEARVGGRVVLDARDLMCALIDAERLESRSSLESRRDRVLGLSGPAPGTSEPAPGRRMARPK